MAGERVKLEVSEREQTGSADARRLRARGFIPGVIYGHGSEADAFVVAERELRRALTGDHGTHAILDVVLGGTKTRHAVLKDTQLHPTRAQLLHIDLQEVRLDETIQAQVTIELVGEPQGVVEGGVLTQVAREANVEALPMEVPDRLELDVAGLAIGDSVRISDLTAPEGVAILDDPEAVVATVGVPTKVEEPEEVVSEEELLEGEELPEGEEAPEGAAEGPAEPEADAAGEQGTTEG
jgi:large subunit ribosomal protein L25